MEGVGGGTLRFFEHPLSGAESAKTPKKTLEREGREAIARAP
jgi:hypothetical protein